MLHNTPAAGGTNLGVDRQWVQRITRSIAEEVGCSLRDRIGAEATKTEHGSEGSGIKRP
jgi:hypothetical protein